VGTTGDYGDDFILESLVLPKTALSVLQCEVSHCPTRETSFLFFEIEVLLKEFFEPNETTLPHNIPYSLTDLVKQILCE
jgi:hypothetical protein